MLFTIGYSVENDKSSLGKMYHYSLPIYSTEISGMVFNEKYSKVHKYLCNIQKPVRFCVIEELGKRKLDETLFKKLVDNNEIENKVTCSSTETIYNHAKLYLTSNTNPNFDINSDLKNKGLMEVVTNKFVEKFECDKPKYKNQKGIYVEDINFDSKFLYDDGYKMEFVRMLLPFARQYYEKGLVVPSLIRKSFSDVCNENDPMKDFIDKYFVMTNLDSDRIHKDDFVKFYNTINKTNLTWSHAINDIKRLGLIYDRKKRINGLAGVIMGIKHTGIDDLND
jgi:hypothetical protein